MFGDNDLSGKRHVAPGKIIGLHERMSYKARLRSAGAIAKAKAQHGLSRFTNEAGDTIVQDRHGEQRPRSFFGLHAARRDERNDRQLAASAFEQQLAEFFA